MNAFRRFMLRFNGRNYRILSLESLLFSGVFGMAFHSWVVFGLMIVGLSWLLNQCRGEVYTAIALSLVWGFIAFGIGTGFGLVWAGVFGGFAVVKGLQLHFRDLQLVWDEFAGFKDAVSWRQNWYGRQNLN